MTRTTFGIRICRLYERTSQRGNAYFAGSCGLVSVAVVKSKFPSREGTEYWELFLDSETPSRRSYSSKKRDITEREEEDDEAPF